MQYRHLCTVKQIILDFDRFGLFWRSRFQVYCLSLIGGLLSVLSFIFSCICPGHFSPTNFASWSWIGWAEVWWLCVRLSSGFYRSDGVSWRPLILSPVTGVCDTSILLCGGVDVKEGMLLLRRFPNNVCWKSEGTKEQHEQMWKQTMVKRKQGKRRQRSRRNTKQV